MSRKTIAGLEARIEEITKMYVVRNDEKIDLLAENESLKEANESIKRVVKREGEKLTKDNEHMRKHLEKMEVMIQTAFRMKHGAPSLGPDGIREIEQETDEHDNLLYLLSDTVVDSLCFPSGRTTSGLFNRTY